MKVYVLIGLDGLPEVYTTKTAVARELNMHPDTLARRFKQRSVYSNGLVSVYERKIHKAKSKARH